MVSVVVPAYNVERYVAQCLDSILSQDGVGMEIIVVNDGSTDATGEIVEGYARRHNNIKVIITANGGLAQARNVGIGAASGEWLAFVDSDDCVMAGAIAHLLDIAVGNGADVAMGGFAMFRGNPPECARIASHDSIEVLSGHEAVEHMLYQNYRSKSVHNSACGKLFRRRLWDGRSYPRGRYYEDLAVVPIVVEGVAKVAVSSRQVYAYRNNPAGIVGSFSLKHYDALVVTRYLAYRFRNDGILAKAARSRHFSAAYNLMLRLRASRWSAPKMYRQCRKIVGMLAWDEITDGSVRLKNRMGALMQYFPFLLRSRWLCRKLLTR